MQSIAMNTERIDELLERYYEALTTEAEEEELKLFFSEGEVPAHLKDEKELFMQMQDACAEVIVPEGLEELLSEAIDDWAIREKISEVRQHSHIYKWRWIGSIAASVLVILTFAWHLHEPKPVRRDTCATSEEAYLEAHNALMQFALTLDKGAQQIAMVHSTTEKIEKSISEYLTLTIK